MLMRCPPIPPSPSHDKLNSDLQTHFECFIIFLSFQFDLITVYIPKAKRLTGAQFCDFPLNVKIAVISAVYRGDMGPKTAKLIREKKWCQVAKEYLDHQGYRTCRERRLSGICKRMEWNAKQFQTMCQKDG